MQPFETHLLPTQALAPILKSHPSQTDAYGSRRDEHDSMAQALELDYRFHDRGEELNLRDERRCRSDD